MASTRNKVALLTGATGQDGAYLSELLLSKGYVVHGLKRRSSSFNTARIEHLYQDPHEPDQRFVLHYGDMTDSTNLIRIIQQVQPDEIYNLAAQSHVAVSFETPEYTANADAVGRAAHTGGDPHPKASKARPLASIRRPTSELYGLVQEVPQSRDNTPFYPRSPYGVGQAVRLLDHGELPARPTASTRRTASCSTTRARFRGETFVTRKITRAAAAIHLGFQQKLFLGNLDARRDWGHAREYVRGMWLMTAAGARATTTSWPPARRQLVRGLRDPWRSLRPAWSWRSSGEGVEEKGVLHKGLAGSTWRWTPATSAQPKWSS